LYTQEELEVMCSDVRALREAGANGIVTGVLCADGTVDEPTLRRLVQLAAPLPVTFHRAIDVSADAVAAVHACARCGVARVLSSGGAPTAGDGVATLRAMVEAAAGRLAIAAGGGVSESNAAPIARASGADELHGSLRTVKRSEMVWRPAVTIHMGSEKLLDAQSEYETREADPSRVAAVVAALAPVAAPERAGQPGTPRATACRTSWAAIATRIHAACLSPRIVGAAGLSAALLLLLRSRARATA
jgi:copper homeostasis protein